MKSAPIWAAAAVGLAAAAAFVSRSARRSEREHPPAGSFVDADGVRLHYTDIGSGPPVVLLHGNGVTAADWSASGIVAALPGARVIAFDRPGFGYSDRPRGRRWDAAAQAAVLHTALSQLGVHGAVVVGHSWGTLPAVELALEHPDDVAHLVLLSGYYFPSMRLEVPAASAPAWPIVGDVLRYTISPILGRLFAPVIVAQLFAPLPVPERFRAVPLSLSLRPSQLRANAEDTALMIPSARALQRRRSDLRVPATILAGREDRIVDPEAQSRRFADQVGAACTLVEGSGHMVHYAATERIAGAILAATRDTQLEGRG